MNTDLLSMTGPVPLKNILALENELRKLPQIEPQITSHFSEGVYAREMFMPKGATVTGKIHKRRNMNILVKGEVSVTTDIGVVRVRAPFIVVSPPGVKRAAYAHEDSIWVTIHGTHETDLAALESEFTAESPEDYLAYANAQLALGSN